MAKLALAVLALATLLIGPCAQAREMRSWRHGIIHPKGDAGFVTMVKEGGFAEREGIALTLVPLQNDTLLVKALLAGELDSYQAGAGATLVAASRGATLAILGCSWTGLPQALYVRQGIASLADLKGKVLAISAPGAQADLLARIMLRQQGIAAGQVNFADMGADAERFKALAAGKVDAAISSAEFAPAAAAQSLTLLLSAAEAAPDLVRYCEVTTEAKAAKERDAVTGFLAADIAAHRYALAHRDETIALARKVIGSAPDDPRPGAMFDFVTRARAIDPDLGMHADKLAGLQAELVESGNIAKPQDIAPLLARAINAAAKARADHSAAPALTGGSK